MTKDCKYYDVSTYLVERQRLEVYKGLIFPNYEIFDSIKWCKKHLKENEWNTETVEVGGTSDYTFIEVIIYFKTEKAYLHYLLSKKNN